MKFVLLLLANPTKKKHQHTHTYAHTYTHAGTFLFLQPPLFTPKSHNSQNIVTKLFSRCLHSLTSVYMYINPFQSMSQIRGEFVLR